MLTELTAPDVAVLDQVDDTARQRIALDVITKPEDSMPPAYCASPAWPDASPARSSAETGGLHLGAYRLISASGRGQSQICDRARPDSSTAVLVAPDEGADVLAPRAVVALVDLPLDEGAQLG
jgi:hypothetical protein